jgi:phospholipase D1/2
VQFARGLSENETAPSPLKRTPTWETDDEGREKDDAVDRTRERRERQASFMGRLKAMASPASSSFHARTPSNNTAGITTPTGALSPQSERSEPLYPVLNEEEEEETGDADGEPDSNDERRAGTLKAKRKRKTKRPQLDGAASTPMATRFASFIKDHQLSNSNNDRPESSSRRAMSDIGEDTRRAGVSEDEGRDKVRNAWKRGIDGARAISYTTRRQNDSEETPGEKRPSHLRRFTGMDAMSSSMGRMRTERHGSGTGSTQRWRQVKAGLKMLGQKKRDERATVDYQKSAQLMAELLAGAPAALVFASMFQRDEHNNRKIPVLLEQLKIKIPSSQTKQDKTGDRHMIFRIELEYGNGPSRMNWVIYRNLRDFVNLHLKYKVQGKTEKLTLRSDDKTKPKIPHFPKTAFPYARGARGLFAGLDDEPDEDDILENGPETPALERPGKHRRRRSSFVLARRQSSINGDDLGGNTAEREARERNTYNERQRKKLEKYLQQMIRWLIFRPDSTRLCHSAYLPRVDM